MSTGIIIEVEDGKSEIGGYYQNLAEEFNDFSAFLKEDGCDLVPYLYCPESYQSEEELREWFEDDEEASEEMIKEAIAWNESVNTRSYAPIREVYGSLLKAREIAANYGEERFHHGREGLLADLDELLGELEQKKEEDLRMLFFRD